MIGRRRIAKDRTVRYLVPARKDVDGPSAHLLPSFQQSPGVRVAGACHVCVSSCGPLGCERRSGVACRGSGACPADAHAEAPPEAPNTGPDSLVSEAQGAGQTSRRGAPLCVAAHAGNPSWREILPCLRLIPEHPVTQSVRVASLTSRDRSVSRAAGVDERIKRPPSGTCGKD